MALADKVVFGMQYVGQCLRDTKIPLFVGSFGGVLNRTMDLD